MTEIEYEVDNDDDEFGDDDIDPVSKLVGEDRKFKSVEDLAKGKLEADAFIEKLLLEKRTLEEELKKRMTVEEILAQLSKTDDTPSNQEPTVDDQPTGEQSATGEQSTSAEEPAGNKEAAVDPSMISKLVEETLRRKAEEERVQRAAEKVLNTLVETFGDKEKAAEEYKKRVDSLGLSKTAQDELLRSNPDAFLKLLGVDSSANKDSGNTSVSPPMENTAPASIPDNTGDNVPLNERTYSWYQKKLRENPRLYSDPNFQKEMHDMALQRGAAFFA